MQNGKNKPSVEAIQDACHENEISLVCQFWANLKPRYSNTSVMYEKVARKKDNWAITMVEK